MTENQNLQTLIKPKRNYSKRRTNLQKFFNCLVENCHQSYSSKIALINHLNKKHPEFRKYKR
jgi:hypothetical protein